MIHELASCKRAGHVEFVALILQGAPLDAGGEGPQADRSGDQQTEERGGDPGEISHRLAFHRAYQEEELGGQGCPEDCEKREQLDAIFALESSLQLKQNLGWVQVVGHRWFLLEVTSRRLNEVTDFVR